MGFYENPGLVWANPLGSLAFFGQNLVTSSLKNNLYINHKALFFQCDVSTCLRPYFRINSLA